MSRSGTVADGSSVHLRHAIRVDENAASPRVARITSHRACHHQDNPVIRDAELPHSTIEAECPRGVAIVEPEGGRGDEDGPGVVSALVLSCCRHLSVIVSSRTKSEAVTSTFTIRVLADHYDEHQEQKQR